MIFRFANSLFARLLVVAFSLVLIGTVGRYFIFSNLIHNDLTSVITANQNTIAVDLARDIEGRVQARLDFLQRLGARLPPGLLDKPEQLALWLDDRQRLLPLFSNGLVVISPTGDGVLAEAPVIAGRDRLSYRDRDWFIEARDHGRTTLGRPYRGRVSNEPLVVMATPLNPTGPAPHAVLAGVTALAAPGFLDVFSKTKIGETGGVLLVSVRDRLFVSSSNPAMVLKDTPAPGINSLHDRAMAGFRGTDITINAFGVEELSSIASVSNTDWFLVVRTPTAEAYSMVSRLQNLIAMFGFINLVIIAVVLALVFPRMLRPLRDSARAMQQMADGLAELEPLPIVRKDEVGTLVAGFNNLLLQLRDRETELREREAQMTRKAHHDMLTGLPNRAMFSQSLLQEIAFTDMAGNAFALMFLDLDGFKPVNDTYGHAAGDELLRQVATRLRDAVRPLDIVARLGGDEFVIITITELDGPRAAAEKVARNCLEAISLPFAVAGKEIRIGVSIGIAICPDDGQEASLLMGHADSALYVAKKAGRGRVEFYRKAQT